MKTNGQVNTTHALRPLGVDEVITHRMSNKLGRPMKLISESGLYKLVMRSDKPEAKQFQDWVTRDVLPAIRKTGSYVAGEENFDLSTDEGLAQATSAVLKAQEEKLAWFQKQHEEDRQKLERLSLDHAELV